MKQRWSILLMSLYALCGKKIMDATVQGVQPRLHHDKLAPDVLCVTVNMDGLTVV